LLAIEISVHGGGVYQNRSVSELHGFTRVPQIPTGGLNRSFSRMKSSNIAQNREGEIQCLLN
jgi:hypothetical protein